MSGDTRETARGGTIRLLAWLLVLPALLVALGLWQVDRSERARLSLDGDRAQLAQSLDELRDLARQSPYASVQFEDGRFVGALLAVGELEDAVWYADLLGRIDAVRHPAAWATAAGGALAMAGGAAGLLLTEIAARRARRSREALVASFGRLWRVLPILLGAVVVGLAAGLMGASLFEATSVPFWAALSGGSLKLAVAGLVIACVALYCAASAVRGLRRVFALATPEPFPERARELTAGDAPALHAFVADLAARLETPPPDTILLGLDGGFYVTENPVRLLPEGRLLEGRTLYLPAPSLELLDEHEIAAILAHELAHFVGEDTRFSVRFVPIHHGLQNSLGALSASVLDGDPISGAGLRLAAHASARFDAAVAHWKRAREFEADRRSAALVGAPANGSALVRSTVAGAPMAFVLAGVFERGADFGPDLVAAGADLAARRGLPDPAGDLAARQFHPTDTHPPTIQRLEALGLRPDEALMRRATRPHDRAAPSFGRRFAADWEGLCRAVSADVVAEAVDLRDAYRGHLEATAAGIGEEALPLFDNTGPARVAALVLGIVFGLVAASFVAMPLVAGLPPQSGAALAVGLILATASAGSLAAFLVLNRRKARPILILRPDALVSPALDRPIPWDDIAGTQIMVGYRFTLRLALHEDAPLPIRLRFSLFNRVRGRKRLVDLGAYGIRGMKLHETSALIERYLAAADARRALAAAPAPGALEAAG